MTCAVVEEAQAPEYRGWVVIEWPAARTGGADYPWAASLPGWGISLYDAMTGKPMTTVSKVVVKAAARGFVTADLTMWATPDGDPVLSAAVTSGACTGDDGEMPTGTFPWIVAAMRVRGSGGIAVGGAGGGGGSSVRGQGGTAVAAGSAGGPGCGGSGALAPDGEPW